MIKAKLLRLLRFANLILPLTDIFQLLQANKDYSYNSYDIYFTHRYGASESICRGIGKWNFAA